jgi:hypothetical protein
MRSLCDYIIAACSGVILLTLVACGATPSLQLACRVDQAVVPLAAGDVATLMGGAGVAVGVAVDTLLVHPAVVALCASVGGVPAVAPPVMPAAVQTAVQVALGKAAPAIGKAATVTTDVNSLIAAGQAAAAAP